MKEIVYNLKPPFINSTNNLEVSEISFGQNWLWRLNKYQNFKSDCIVHIQYIFIIFLSVWPVFLKSTNAVPMHKTGEKSTTSNCKPISLISNIYEKNVYNRMYNFFSECQIVSEAQCSWVKGRRTIKLKT